MTASAGMDVNTGWGFDGMEKLRASGRNASAGFREARIQQTNNKEKRGLLSNGPKAPGEIKGGRCVCVRERGRTRPTRENKYKK